MMRSGFYATSQCWLGLLPCALLVGAAVLPAPAKALDRTATLVLHNTMRMSAVSQAEMQAELRRQVGDLTAVRFLSATDLRLGQSVVRPIQVRFRGDCRMTALAARPAKPGAFAWAHVSDGKVLPFVEVDCSRVRGSILSVMWGEDFQHRDLLLGRALGRVLAHELHHVLDSTVDHTHQGLTKPALRATELIRGEDPVAIGGS